MLSRYTQQEILTSFWRVSASVRGNTYVHISGTLSGSDAAEEGAVVCVLEFSEALTKEDLYGTEISFSERFGPFVYVRADSASELKFRSSFLVPRSTKLVSLSFRLWNSSGPLAFEILEIDDGEGVSSQLNGRELLVNLSIDVEALPHRAASQHVDRLIYGRGWGDFECGVPLLLDVMSDYGVSATCYLEMGSCSLYGDQTLIDVGKYILDRGADLQLHLHSEVLWRAERWPWSSVSPPRLDNLDLMQTRRAMGYAIERFKKIRETAPVAFRAGGYLFNASTVQVGRELGLGAHSNFRADQRANNAYDFVSDGPMRPFKWDNGLFELTITISPEPLNALSAEECWRRILHHNDVNKSWLVNIVIHSWSLMERGQDGYHSWKGDALLKCLRQLIMKAPKGVRFVTAKEVVESLMGGENTVDIVRSTDDLVRRKS
ncbi:MAG: hypothetical protein EWV69_10110 [Microcystis panniformis Mp_MB_F_20080800_S26]|nr:MAG: hypothetical protein EWV69_10110 [Microcystis panniformis Mp_MB_F_20080800_S26]